MSCATTFSFHSSQPNPLAEFLNPSGTAMAEHYSPYMTQGTMSSAPSSSPPPKQILLPSTWAPKATCSISNVPDEFLNKLCRRLCLVKARRMAVESGAARQTMKAVVVHEFGGPEVLSYEDAAIPTAGPGEVG